MKTTLLLLLSMITANVLFAQTDSTQSSNPATPLVQQVVVDSSLLDRVTALEQEASYNKPGDDHLMIVGLTTFGFVSNKTTVTYNGSSTVTKTNNIGDADHFEFSPMLLWRHGKKFLLEFEPSFSAGGVGVNWGAISYFATPGLI